MKKLLIPISFIGIFVACNNAPKSDKAETTEKQEVKEEKVNKGVEYTTDAASVITWTGTQPTSRHTGTFKLKEGNLTVNENKLAGGRFIIDITSLTDTDLKNATKKNTLETHLKSADFFEVGKYPTGTFEITSVEPFMYDSIANKDIIMKDASHMIKGNLTLKGTTKNISFPAKVNITGDNLTAHADFMIDRSEWGINYKGMNNPKDWVIKKEVNVKLDIKATKK